MGSYFKQLVNQTVIGYVFNPSVQMTFLSTFFTNRYFVSKKKYFISAVNISYCGSDTNARRPNFVHGSLRQAKGPQKDHLMYCRHTHSTNILYAYQNSC